MWNSTFDHNVYDHAVKKVHIQNSVTVGNSSKFFVYLAFFFVLFFLFNIRHRLDSNLVH